MLTNIVFHLVLLSFFLHSLPSDIFCQEPRQKRVTVRTGQWKNRAIQYIDHRIGVKLRSFTENSIDRHSKLLKAEVLERFPGVRWVVLELPDHLDVLSAIDQVATQAEVESVVPIAVFTDDSFFPPNDPSFIPDQWYLFHMADWGLDGDINIASLWEYEMTTGDPDVVVSILDTGIPLSEGRYLIHPDLSDSRIILGPDLIYPIVHDPGNPTYENDASINDENGHGTHVAGLVGAKSNNGIGIAGVTWNCQLLIVQTHGKMGLDFWGHQRWGAPGEAIRNGIYYAVDYGLTHGKKVVINLSSSAQIDEDPYVEDALAYAYANGAVLACAAGNYSIPVAGGSLGRPIGYPAKRSAVYPNVIAVGATGYSGEHSNFSSVGPELNLCAPGGQATYVPDGAPIISYPIYSTWPPTGYNTLIGTSQATPQVAGAAASILSVHKDLAPAEVRDVLESTAYWNDINCHETLKEYCIRNDEYGNGVLHVFDAVTRAFVPHVPTLSSPPHQSTSQPLSLTLSWNACQTATSFRLQLSTNSTFTEIVQDTSGITTMSYGLTGLSNGTTYWWRVNASTSHGTSEWSNSRAFTTVVVPPPPPVLLSPATGSYIDECSVDLVWNTAPTATSYHIQVSRNTTFTLLLADVDNYTSTSYTVNNHDRWYLKYWRVASKNVAGQSGWSYSSPWWFQFNMDFCECYSEVCKEGVPVAVREPPVAFQLAQNHPNPFNPRTTIPIALQQDASVTLTIFNVLGERVHTPIAHREMPAGYHSIVVEASELPTGVYFYRLDVSSSVQGPIEYSAMKKFLLAK